MKKATAILSILLAALLALTACSAAPETSEATPTATPAPTEAEATAEPTVTPGAETSGAYTLNVAALLGPTGIGMVKLMDDADSGLYADQFNANISLSSAPDEISGKLITGELDIACVPTNLAAVLYNKTEGGVKMAALNTLGVLYVLEKGDSVNSVADLAGKTVYATGEGSMPEYIIDYVLAQNGITDSVTVDYLTEHSELAAKAIAGDVDLCILPEPFVSMVTAKNPDMRVALSLTDAWNEASGGTELSMGCIVVRSALLETEEGKAAVDAFLEAYSESAHYVAENPAEAAKLVVKYGIMDDETLAAATIPRCNIVFIEGDEMGICANALYQVLYAANPKSIGGALPDDALYYSRFTASTTKAN